MVSCRDLGGVHETMECPMEVLHLCKQCLSLNPLHRPTAAAIVSRLDALGNG